MINFSDNPTLKNQFRAAFMDIIYAPYKERREKVLAKIIERNCVLKNTDRACFTYKGEYYGAMYAGAFERPKLHPELVEEFSLWLQEDKDVQRFERPIIENFLIGVMHSSSVLLDWLRIFPDCLHAPVKNVMGQIGPEIAELPDEQVALYIHQHSDAIEKVRSRMMMNLLLS